MKKLTPAQKARRAMNRKKYKHQHHTFVAMGDNAATPERRAEYYQMAQDAFRKYQENGGRE